MHIGFVYPAALVLLGPLAVWMWLFFRREEKSYFIDPWADHLAIRLGSGRLRSHRSFLFSAVAMGMLVLMFAQPWYGVRLVKTTEKARLINFQFDVSGSMIPQGLSAAREVARHIIRTHPEDRVNTVFFASESEATSFGIPESYLDYNPDLVELYANALGGSTVAAHALYASFRSIALEDQLLPVGELDELYRRVCVPLPGSADAQADDAQADNGCPAHTSNPETRRKDFATYLDAYISQHPVKPADRMSIFISDCDLSYEGYDLQSVMMLYQAYGIRLEAVCIGDTDLKAKTDANNKAFVEGVLATGGDIRNIRPTGYVSREIEQKPTSWVTVPVFDDLPGHLQELVDRVETMKPREIISSIMVEKRLLTDECFWAALALLIAAAFVERRFA